MDADRHAGKVRWKTLLALILLAALVRLPSLLHPGPIDDERVYAVVANEIVHGGLPYIDAVERKPPLLFWTYAAVFKVAGPSNWLALHLAALLWTLGTMAGLHVLVSRRFGTRSGLAAAMLYGCFQSWGVWTNLAFNGEMLMNLPLVWAFVLAMRSTDKRGIAVDALGAGVLLGAAFLLKQPSAIAGLPLAAALARRGVDGRFALPSLGASLRVLAVGLAFVAGIAAPLAAAAAVLHGQGILAEAIYWTVWDHDLPHVFWSRALEHTALFAVACLPVLCAAAMAVRAGQWDERKADLCILLLWLAVSAIGASAGGRFYPHYYIQLLPPLVAIGAPALAGAWAPGRTCPWPLRKGFIALLLAAFAVSQWVGLAPQRKAWQVAGYVRAQSSPADRIFVWGHSPEIYLQSGRRPATRYIMTFPLTGYVFGPAIPGLDTSKRILHGAWRNLAADFARHPPLFIVDVETKPESRYPLSRFPNFSRMIGREYRKVAATPEAVVYRRIES